MAERFNVFVCVMSAFQTEQFHKKCTFNEKYNFNDFVLYFPNYTNWFFKCTTFHPERFYFLRPHIYLTTTAASSYFKYNLNDDLLKYVTCRKKCQH